MAGCDCGNHCSNCGGCNGSHKHWCVNRGARLAVMLVLLSVALTACGHKDYDDFVNNSVSEQYAWLGQLGLVCIVVFAAVGFMVNRAFDSKWADAAMGSLLIAAMGVGLGYLDDPDGWLEVRTPLIEQMARR